MSPDDLLFGAAVAAIGVLAGGTAAVIGFGIGSLMTPLLITRVDPHLAVSLIVVPHMLATALRYWQHRGSVDRSLFRRFGIPSAAGAFLGAALQGALTSRWLVVTLGALLIASGISNLRQRPGNRKPSQSAAVLLGALAGFFGGVVGNQGGVRAAGLRAFPLSPRSFLATGTAVALLVDVARTPVYLLRSWRPLLDLAPVVALASAGCLLGTILGERILLGMSADRYRRVLGTAVAAIGVWLCVQGIRK
jgi:uncharacterized membrane protein YfcA